MVSKKKPKLIILSELEKTLLTLLYGQSLYGSQFIEAIRLLHEDDREIGFGSLYPTLSRMEKKGFVSCDWGDEAMGPRRKYYTLTPNGKNVLEKDWRFHEKLKHYRVASDKDASSADVDRKASLIRINS